MEGAEAKKKKEKKTSHCRSPNNWFKSSCIHSCSYSLFKRSAHDGIAPLQARLCSLFNPALEDCNGLKLLVVSSHSCLRALAPAVCFRRARRVAPVEMKGFRPLKNRGAISMMQPATCKSVRNDGNQTKRRRRVALFLVFFFPLQKAQGLKQYAVCSELTPVAP